jgi:site-specific DNA recombinase
MSAGADRTPATTADDAAATAVLYLRVSSAGQVNRGTDPEGYSIPGQREAATARASSLGADVLEEYVEYGVSGRSTKRPALQRMLADLKTHRPTYVIIYDLSRLARNRLDDAQLMLLIESSGAKLVSVLENIDQTASGRLTHGVLAAVNEFRSAGDAEKVKMGVQRKHATGGRHGRAPIGYLNVRRRELGRDIRTVEIDEERAPLVRMAFRCYASGEYSISGITELLDAGGLKTHMTAKRPPAALARSAVHRILKDDFYIGVVTLNGVKNYDGLHQPLIDVETFERVQEVLRGHALSGERSHKHQQYLKGSVFCGQCEGRLVFTPVRGNGGRYEYFRCFGRHNLRNGCMAPHMAVEVVEAAVERYYMRTRWLSNAEQDCVRAAVGRYAELKLQTAEREIERASKRLEALKAEQQRLLQLSYRDLVDDEVLAVEQTRIRGERVQVAKWAKTAELDVADISLALEEALRLLDDPGTAYRRATPVTRRMFNQALFERLLIDEGEVVDITPAPWVEALRAVARERETADLESQDTAEWLRKVGVDRTGAGNDRSPQFGGFGLNVDQMVRMRGLEPPRACTHGDLNAARLPIPPHPPARQP